MQTFLPYADFHRSAEALDPRRLGKQRVETLQILRALHFDGYGWRNHPAVLMWRGYVPALVAYGLAMAEAWTALGRPDITAPKIAEFDVAGPRTHAQLGAAGLLPPWLGERRLHRSHQAALVRKDPAWYRRHFPDVPDDLPYWWPEAGPDVPPGEVAAWIVRGRRVPDAVELDLASLGGPRRAELAVRRFVEELDDPGVVLVPDGDVLHEGRVTGPAVHLPTMLRRLVRWTGTRSTADLPFPAALQNPQPVAPVLNAPARRQCGVPQAGEIGGYSHSS